MQVWGYWY